MALPLLAAAVGVGVSFPLAVLSRPAIQEQTDRLGSALDPNRDTETVTGPVGNVMPDMSPSDGDFNITGIITQIAVFIALLVFGRTVIQEVI